jgi:hypothetical protein
MDIQANSCGCQIYEAWSWCCTAAANRMAQQPSHHSTVFPDGVVIHRTKCSHTTPHQSSIKSPWRLNSGRCVNPHYAVLVTTITCSHLFSEKYVWNLQAIRNRRATMADRSHNYFPIRTQIYWRWTCSDSQYYSWRNLISARLRDGQQHRRNFKK